MSVPHAVESLIADEPLSAHLATSVRDRPHVAPVWYHYDDGVLSVLTGGKKLRNVRRNPHVAASIEKTSDGRVEWTVTLLGTARVVDDPDRVRAVESRIAATYRGDGDATLESDGGEDSGGALVAIDVGSATYSRY